MLNRIDLHESYMQIAEIRAQRSKAIRKKVGAIIVKDDTIISDGYNGVPSGAKDDTCEYVDEDGNLKTKDDVLHAESNALMKLVRNAGSPSSSGATLYVTMSPCKDCAKLIIQSKITTVYFRELYRDSSGVDKLKEYGVVVNQI